MTRAIVKEFRPEAGFGTLELDDGSTLAFDVAVCNSRYVVAGAACEVTVGVGRRGERKATLVELPLARDARATLDAFLRRAHDNGLLREWTLADVEAHAGSPEIDGAGAGALVARYYGHGATARARDDRVLVLDWRRATDVTSAVAAFATLAALEGVRQVEDLGGTVVVADGHGEPESVDVTGTLEPLADWFDEALERRGRAERWLGLPSGGEAEAFALRDPAAATLPLV